MFPEFNVRLNMLTSGPSDAEEQYLRFISENIPEDLQDMDKPDII